MSEHLSEIVNVESRRLRDVGDTWRSVRDLVVMIVLAAVIAQATRAFAIQPYVVPSGSMLPTIELFDHVIAEKITYEIVRGPRQGEVVVFDNPRPANRDEKTLIKRVIAVEGQTVDIREGKVWVDGVALDEPYTHGKPTESGSVRMPVAVPKGSVWLMGDNRPNSSDCRVLGPQPISHVRGRAIWTYWPPSRFGELD